MERGRLSEELKNGLKAELDSLNAEAEEEKTVIYYRWYYKDDQKTFGIEETRNVPGVRWLLYNTALANQGKFFFSVNREDLEVVPEDPTRPRIGPFAPPVPPKGSVPDTAVKNISQYRKYKVETFTKALKTVVEQAKRNKAPLIGEIYCRWHFTDFHLQNKKYEVITRDNTQPVRDLYTEYLVRYPNQFWVSFNIKDMEIQDIDGIRRPKQGASELTVIGPSTSASTGSAASSSAAASTSTAGTGQTQPKPSPDGGSATKKRKSGSTAPSTVSKPPHESTTSGSTEGSGSAHTQQSPTEEPAKKKVKKEDKPQEEKK